jgi:hypothetical protein
LPVLLGVASPVDVVFGLVFGLEVVLVFGFDVFGFAGNS